MTAPPQVPPSTSSSPVAGEDERAALASARASTYRFLAALTLGPPAPAALAALRSGDLRAFFPVAFEDTNLAAALANFAAHEPDERAIADEYHALFVVPGKRYCAPFESVYLDVEQAPDRSGERGLLWGPSTVAVRRFYVETGLPLASDAGELPDHVGTELLFLACLCDDEADAWRSGDEARAAERGERRLEFLRLHLGRFAPRLCDALVVHASQPYFHAVAALLRAFAAAESAG